MQSIAHRPWVEPAGLGAATLAIAGALFLVPSWRGFVADPCLHAAALAGLTILLLHITRRVGPRAMAFERALVAMFLAGMPLIYIASWFARGSGADQSWLWIEVVAFPAFGALALFGLRRPWLLVLGIAAHGIAWDLWHVDSGYIPTWYAIACFLADVGLSVYVAARIPAWKASRAGRAHPPGPQARSPFEPDRSARLPT